MKSLVITRIGLLAIAMALAGCATQPRGDGWITLFDGSNLENWNRVGEANWQLTEGAVMADKSGKTPSYLVSKRAYADFELKVDFWVDENANSGVFIRCSDPVRVGAATADEVQIADKRTDGYGTAAITDLARVTPAIQSAGRWNSYLITARGRQLTVALDGKVTAIIEDSRYANGPVALQYISGIVKFRNVAIRPF